MNLLGGCASALHCLAALRLGLHPLEAGPCPRDLPLSCVRLSCPWVVSAVWLLFLQSWLQPGYMAAPSACMPNTHCHAGVEVAVVPQHHLLCCLIALVASFLNQLKSGSFSAPPWTLPRASTAQQAHPRATVQALLGSRSVAGLLCCAGMGSEMMSG